MTRRWALAASLVLTVFVGFLVLTYGTNAGVFAWSGGSGGSQAPTIIGASPAEQLPAQAPALALPAAAGELVNLDQTSLQPSDQPAVGDGHKREGDAEDHERDRSEGEHDGDD